MALNHSPKIVTDGLVFAYDMANTQKSWKGAPATNLLINSVIPFANIYNFPNSTGTITQNYRQAPDGTNTAQQLSSAGTGIGTQFYTNVVTSTPSGTVYTFSFYTLSSSQTGWVIGGVGINQCTINSTTNISLPNGWYRWVVVVTTNTNNAIIALMAQVSIGTTIIVWGGQIELGSFATPLIPTISAIASRSNTQAIVDLVGNNTVTASSLTYSSDGTFSFNGSSNFINLNTNIQSGYTGASYEFWCRTTSLPSSGNYFQLYIQENSTWIGLYNLGAGAFFGIDLNNGSGWFDNNGGSNTGARTTATLSSNTNYYVAYSWNGSTVSVYLNGNLQATASTLQAANGRQNVTQLGAGATSRNIGSRYDGSSANWVGSIYSTKFYNRALSATEVLQNFNAHRGRYDI